MRNSESWARGLMNQNVTMKVGNLNVMTRFGTHVRSQPNPRKKPKVEDEKFVVGETVVGGEETV